MFIYNVRHLSSQVSAIIRYFVIIEVSSQVSECICIYLTTQVNMKGEYGGHVWATPPVSGCYDAVSHCHDQYEHHLSARAQSF
jgi:hypothetical protein